MTIFFTLFVCVISILGSKKIFNKWFNHISIYVASWTLFLVLYEIKLIRYIPLTQTTWLVIIVAYVAFLLGVATIFVARSLFDIETDIFYSKKKYKLFFTPEILRVIKNLTIFFIALSFFSAFQHWYVLINKFGDIATVLIKANLVYRERVSGEMSGTLPYLYISGFIAVFLSAVYSAHKNNIGLFAILAMLSVIIKDTASVGRAGIFVAALLYIITFVLTKHLLSNYDSEIKKKNNSQLIIASVVSIVLVLGSMTLVKEFRGTVESFQASSKGLNKMKDVPLLSPSIYLYFSSNVGVLSKYLDHDNEDLLIGENTFLPIYNLISKFGPVELKQRRNYFSSLVTSIIGQQLSVHSARAIINRFSQHFESEITPEKIISSDFQSLRSLGLSNAKSKYVIDLSHKLLSGEIKLNGISKLSESEIMNELTKVRGIGPWTVHMFLIFVLGKPNILPEGDLGIKKAIMLNYNFKNLPTGEEVIKLSKNKNWAPYKTYASLYLWKSIDGK